MSRKGPIFWRTAVLVTLAGLVAGGLAYQLTQPDEPELAPPDAGPAAPVEQLPNVFFVVLDMLRADHLSLCGYERPTTPNLIKLAQSSGATATCRAYSPGTWTLPSHASFLTGEEVPVHGADSLGQPEGKESVSLWGDPVRPLGKGLPTLAEQLRQAGYKTLLVSGNPIVSSQARTGLDRGFELIAESEQFGDLYGNRLLDALERALDQTGGQQPLFVFINVCDAHHPWHPIPPGMGWIDPRPGLDNRPRFPKTPYPRFLRGEMDADEKARFLEHARDSYDYAVWRADRTFAGVIRALKERGLHDRGYRLVVVSDHGEFLGEHDLLSHAIFTYEPDTRVPLVYVDSTRERLQLDEPIAALTAYDLVLAGQLPAKPRPVRAVGYPDALMSELFGDRLMTTTAAWWTGQEKLFWINGKYSLFDLKADPDELAPQPLPDDHPLKKRFEGFIAQVKATADRESEPSPEMIEALRRLGYVK
jgi:arylsulfatase A-like enzyme